MGLAISGMHYGDAGGVFSAHGPVPPVPAILDQTNMALAVAATTFMILACALIASLFDRQFAVLAERGTVLRESEERFRTLYATRPFRCIPSIPTDASIR